MSNAIRIFALLLVALLLVGPTAFAQGGGITQTTEITGSLELDGDPGAEAAPATGATIPWVPILVVVVLVLLLSSMFVWRGRHPADGPIDDHHHH